MNVDKFHVLFVFVSCFTVFEVLVISSVRMTMLLYQIIDIMSRRTTNIVVLAYVV
ncbi:hypothetical protein HanPI659440_Chr16g0628001 [Helianthus annuus]|nr:hypothetical protein HanPI659440_Chr16g0628001 [Helianthus annuus]